MLDCFTKGRRLTLGVAPTRRVQNTNKPGALQDALQVKALVMAAMEKLDADIVSLDGLNQEGTLFHPADAARAAERFRAAGVDALFLPHCNFGCEEAAARLAKMVGKPTLLWGPQGSVNGENHYRYFDAQCGLLATSKALQLYGVPFTYIVNCPLESPTFAQGMDTFLRAATVVRAMNAPRIGQIGTRPASFLTVKCNEAQLLERFGIEVTPITLPELGDRLAHLKREAWLPQAQELREAYQCRGFEAEKLDRVAALKVALEGWALEEGLSAIALQCWKPMAVTAGIAPCLAMGEACNDGLPCICEADIHGAVSALLALSAARYRLPMCLAEPVIRHPTNPNAEQFWHCGVFPRSLAQKGRPLVAAPHPNSGNPAAGAFPLAQGPVTILRFDQRAGDYALLLGEGRGIDGPETNGSYLWVEVHDWEKWERKLVYGPYIHHCAMIHGAYKSALAEACRYLPGLTPDLV